MKACPCDPSLVGLLKAFPPVIANGVAWYPNPRTPVEAVKTVRALERELCVACRKEIGL